jgi:hypothetical protein
MKKNESRAQKTSTTIASHKTQATSTTLAPPLTISDEELYERVTRKAYELYQQRAEEPSHDLEDWLTAEQLVKEELLHGPVLEDPRHFLARPASRTHSNS